jgi:glucose-1-phosphate adenylyltransferase
VTIVTTEVPRDEAGRFGVLEADEDGRVTRFAYKPDEPFSGTVTTEVFVYTASVLLDTLEELAQEAEADSDDDDGDEAQDGPSLQDFGHGLLPRLVDSGRAFAFPLDGYWRDLGTVESYWQGHMDLLDDGNGDDTRRRLDLDDPDWPILTVGHQRMPARLLGAAAVTDSLIAPGCVIRGTVHRSVLAPGVVVEDGAEVRSSVVMRDTVIGRGSVVRGTVVDSNVQIGADARIGGDPEARSPAELTLVGRGAQVEDGTEVPAGGRVEGRPREAVKARGLI